MVKTKRKTAIGTRARTIKPEDKEAAVKELTKIIVDCGQAMKYIQNRSYDRALKNCRAAGKACMKIRL